MSLAKAGQLTSYSSTYGYPVEEPAERPSIAFWLCQLYHRGGDTHGRGSSCEYVLNKHPIIILFDSGALQDFISSACAKRAKLTLVASGAPCMISTPGGRVHTDRITHKVPLKLYRRGFSTSLIVFSAQGIDAILGMRWMKLHKAILGIASRLVCLDSPLYGKVTMHLPAISRIKASLHHVVELKLEDIRVI
jgi:hypothetical protein